MVNSGYELVDVFSGLDNPDTYLYIKSFRLDTLHIFAQHSIAFSYS